MTTDAEDYDAQCDLNRDLEDEYESGAKEALKRVLAAVQIRHKFDADDVRQIAEQMGVEL
jgi:hypothetical protein